MVIEMKGEIIEEQFYGLNALSSTPIGFNELSCFPLRKVIGVWSY